MKINFVYGIITLLLQQNFSLIGKLIMHLKAWPFCFSFISLVPDEIKTSALTGDTGYDTYLRDAHRQVHKISSD